VGEGVFTKGPGGVIVESEESRKYSAGLAKAAFGAWPQEDKATFYAEVDKVQTMADGSIRVVLGLGEDGLKVMRFLAGCKQKGIVLDIKATARPG